MTDLSITRAGAFLQQAGNNEEKLKQAAAQFEALFLNQLMKQGKSFGGDEGSIFGNSAAERNYKELLNNALAEGAAGGIGVADAILDQLQVQRNMEAQQAAKESNNG